MQFLARSLSRSIRTSLSSTTRKSWALSRQCHSNFSSTNSSYGESSDEKPPEWPRPKEIPYQPKVENCVDLIGYVSQPVLFNSPQDGKFWAGTVISYAPSSASESELESRANFRLPVVFEGELAQTANCHLKKGDRIHISGQIFVDFTPFGFEANPGQANVQANLQVMVREFQCIKDSKDSHKVLPTSDNKEDVLKHSASVQKRGNLGTGGWFDLVDKPDEWCDYRESKHNGLVNPKHPDFKKKDGTLALWLNKAPSDILSNLQDVEFDTPFKSKNIIQKSGEESWKDLVENKNKWWDNRLNKKNPKGPDFMHKETRVALWLKDCPNELLTKLPSLNKDVPTPKKSSHEPETVSVQNRQDFRSDWSNLLEKPGEWCDYRESKENGSVNAKYPDFKKKDGSVALWLSKAPYGILTSLKDVKFDTPAKSKYSKQNAGEESWKDLVENKDKWWDNRLNKKYPKAPDFKHKETGVGLWLDNCPSEWKTKLSLPTHEKSPNASDTPVKSNYVNQNKAGEESWKDLVENKDKWWDNRSGKINPKAPDFKHKETGVGLWLKNCPSEWKTKLPLPTPKKSPNESDTPVKSNYANQNKAREELWKDLVNNLDRWMDNRLNKKNPKAPDFKHKDTGEALWLNNCPDWVQTRLPPFKGADDTTFMKI